MMLVEDLELEGFGKIIMLRYLSFFSHFRHFLLKAAVMEASYLSVLYTHPV